MISDTNIWLERLTSLHKSQTRKAANSEGLQLVHLEILQYLEICNKYSNTAQALSEYLGQTKGSISQSLKFIEKSGHIERKPCQRDGRVTRINLTAKGKACLKRINKNPLLELPEDKAMTKAMKKLLQRWQNMNSLKSFGQCQSCHYNKILKNGKFQCGLTSEPLSKTDIKKICKEHEFSQRHPLN